MRRKNKTIRDICRTWQLTREQEVFIILYMVTGYSMIDAYRISHPDSKATIGMASLASHLLAVLEPVAIQIAEAVRAGGIKLPKKFGQ